MPPEKKKAETQHHGRDHKEGIMVRQAEQLERSWRQRGPIPEAFRPGFLLLCLVLGLVLTCTAGCNNGSETQQEPAGPVVENTCPALGTPMDPDSETAMVFDLSGDTKSGGLDFFDLPYPLDMRLDENGKTDLSGFPNPGDNAEVRQIIQAAHLHMEGWPTATQVFLRLTGPVDEGRIPSDPAAFVSTGAVIQLLDVDPDSPERGRRFPLEVAFNSVREKFRPENLIQVLPVQGFELRENNHYAVIVTRDLASKNGLQPVSEPNLCAVMSGRTPVGALAAEALEAYAPLAGQLAREGIDPGTILAATVFTTGAPTERMFHVTDRVGDWPAPQPAAPLVKTDEFDEYCVYASEWEVPGLQQGRIPFLAVRDGGVIQFDADKEPVVQYTRMAPFVVTVPKGEMPAQGYPLLFYIHGTGGLSTQVYKRGPVLPDGSVPPGTGPSEVAAERGWGSSCMGGHLSVEQLGEFGSLGGYIPYNFFNLQAMRDNFIQMTAEQILFRRLLNDLAIDVSGCEGADVSATPDGMARFDPQMQVVMGQSLGSHLSGLVGATDPKAWQGAILTGAGGSWTEYALGPQDPPLPVLLEFFLGMPLNEHLDRWHPAIQIATLSIAGANTIHFLPTYFRDPRLPRPSPHMLVIEGHIDLQNTIGLQRALVAALGVDMVGPDVAEIPPGIPIGPEGQIIQRIELAGGRQLDPPVSGNMNVPGQGVRTAVVVRYPEDGIREGHYVVFQREEPKHQYGCFLEDLAAGKVPTIIEGVAQGGECAP